MLREFGRVVLCTISCALLVLLVPSSAWSEDGDTLPSEPSASSSPASASESPSLDPQSGPSSPSSSSAPSSPSDTSTVSPGVSEPVPAEPETVYVVTESPAPEPASMTLEGDPAVVSLSDEDRALIGLAACLLALGVGARIVGSFA